MCPCCDFCVIDGKQRKRQKSRPQQLWKQLYKHFKSSESSNKNVYDIYEDQNTDLDLATYTRISKNHIVKMKVSRKLLNVLTTL